MTNAIPFHLLLLLSLFTLSAATSTVTLSLSHFNTNPLPHSSIYHRLNHLASASLARAHILKNPKPSTTTTTTTTTPLSPHSYGGYSISLSFGTPPQTIPFIMDTGSNFVWFPCTHNYLCKNCSFNSQDDKSHIPTFIPKLSSTARIVGCLNPKCGWIHDPNTQTRCPECAASSSNCTMICPPYLIIYGSGSTGGLALLDTLYLANKKEPNFLVGCSLFSSRQPAGIAGLGRGETGLPSQLGLSKFSYCLVSHRFDDTHMSSAMNLTVAGKSISGEKVAGIRYTPFLKNPKVESKKRYSVYYYLGLKNIFVGGKKVKIPRPYLSPADPYIGNGGAIVDSGTTFTYMAREIFEPLARAMETRAGAYRRVKAVEDLTGLRPCFNISGLETVSLPSLRFKFKGGADMIFPLENYFSIAGNEEAVCLTIVSDPPGREEMGGPRVILGNFQMQNYYTEYDLKNNRFGFMPKKCG